MSFEISEDLKKRAEEVRRKAETEELLRIGELERSVTEFARNRYQDFFRQYEAKLIEAEKHRKHSENVLLEREVAIQRLLKIERARKIEIRKQDEEEQKKQEEESQRRREEEERLRIEQEKIKFEEERIRQIDDEKRRLEDERRLREELDRRRQEEEKARREEEDARKKEEREIRIQMMLEEAKLHLDRGDFDRALIEIAKALVHDPHHAEALALKKQIQATHQMFEPIVEEEIAATEVAEETEIEKPAEIKLSPPQFKTPRRVPWLALIMVAVVVVGVIISQLIPIIFPPVPSIAIKSFKSSTGILEDEILGRALSQEISNRLATIPGFKTMGISSIRTLENYSTNINKLIVAAGFHYQLEGIISRSDKQRIIDLSLLDSANNVIWKKQIRKDENYINEIPPEICKDILDEFHIEDSEKNQQAFRISSNNNTAFFLYLRGLELLQRNTPESCENAEQLFDYAGTEDNSFTEAFAASGYASILKIENGWDKSIKVFAKAEDMLQRADISTHKTILTKSYLGLLNIYNNRFTAANSDLNEVIKLNPNISDNYTAIGKLYIFTGKYSDAIDALTKAYNLDPFNPEIVKLITTAHQLKEEYNNALSIYNGYLPLTKDSSTYINKYLSNVIMYDPELLMKYSYRLVKIFEDLIIQNPKDYEIRYKLARLYQGIGQTKDATPLLMKALDYVELGLTMKPNDANLEIYRALIYTRLGRFAEAEKLSQRAIALAPENYEINYKAARMYAIQAGRSDTLKVKTKDKRNPEQAFSKALDKLQKAVSLHYSTEEILDIDFYNLRKTPEFLGAIRMKEK